jgi:hypothetical protein
VFVERAERPWSKGVGSESYIFRCRAQLHRDPVEYCKLQDETTLNPSLPLMFWQRTTGVMLICTWTLEQYLEVMTSCQNDSLEAFLQHSVMWVFIMKRASFVYKLLRLWHLTD